jgi:hypothetical protein
VVLGVCGDSFGGERESPQAMKETGSSGLDWVDWIGWTGRPTQSEERAAWARATPGPTRLGETPTKARAPALVQTPHGAPIQYLDVQAPRPSASCHALAA